MEHYADQRREEFGLDGRAAAPTSALLPMGGAVSDVAGPNWALIGDAAACVNPLNGEGIDYGLETGRLVAEVLAEHDDLVARCGRRCCATTTARRSRSPGGSRAWSPCRGCCRRWARPGCARDWLMTLALRWMGNLVTDEDRDRAARVWRWAGRRSVRLDERPPFS